MEPDRRYTLAELSDACAAALDALGIAARNGQVRDRPDARTIRYYTTLGLVDRPAEMTGRTALYDGRHLLQVLAVKALQARGASLADVQRSLVGASDEELRRAIGPGLPAALAARPAGAGTGRAFWRTPPAAPPRTAAAHQPARLGPAELAPDRAGPAWLAPARPAPARPGSARPRPAPQAAGAAQNPPGPPRPLIAIPLAEGATLLIEDADAGALDAAALREAAAPLLAHLTAAGLLPGPPT